METVVIRERFELARKLGQGGQAVTWLATDRETGDEVVVKHLALTQTERWKQIELFEREGDVLEGFDHPRIPAYVGAFAEAGEEGVDFYLVQEYIDGFTLAEELSAQGTWSQEKGVEDLKAMLEVLEWLQSRVPPVVHRDIKPTNIMRRGEDGELVLIDFGAVQLAGTDASFASTFVGTASYMAFEQMSGKAVPASDVYSLGVTMCQLLTGVPPSQVEMEGSALGYGALLRERGVSGRLLEVLERMIQLSLNERYPNAGAALRALLKTKPTEVAAPERGGGGGSDDGERVRFAVLGGARRGEVLGRLFGGKTVRQLVGLSVVERAIMEAWKDTDNGFLFMASEHGYELTQYQDWFGFPFYESVQMWSAADGLAQIMVSKGLDAGGQGVRTFRRLVTTFEDGYQIITYPTRDPSLSRTHRVVVGSGDFLRDHREHMRAVERYAAKEGVAVVPHLRLEHLASLYDGYKYSTTMGFRFGLALATGGMLVPMALLILPLLYLYGRSNSVPSQPEALPALGYEEESSGVVFAFDEYGEFEVAEAEHVEIGEGG